MKTWQNMTHRQTSNYNVTNENCNNIIDHNYAVSDKFSNQGNVFSQRPASYTTETDKKIVKGSEALATKRTSKHVTYILGDSLVKDVKGWKIQEKLVNKQQVIVKSFSGAKTECMSEYVKPTLKRNPDRIILHTGTNDLSTDSTDKELATSIINLVTDISASCPSISVSGIVPRADQYAKKQGMLIKF